MTNGSKENTQKFLERTKLDCVSPVLDVEGPRAWKPCRAAYQYVPDQLGLQAEQVTDVHTEEYHRTVSQHSHTRAETLQHQLSEDPDTSILLPRHDAIS